MTTTTCFPMRDEVGAQQAADALPGRHRRRWRRGRLRVPVGARPQRRRVRDDPNEYMPYPRKLPYPNPLDGDDANTDHDGDILTLLEEFKLWKFYAVAAGSPATLEPPRATRPASSTRPAPAPAAPGRARRLDGRELRQAAREFVRLGRVRAATGSVRSVRRSSDDDGLGAITGARHFRIRDFDLAAVASSPTSIDVLRPTTRNGVLSRRLRARRGRRRPVELAPRPRLHARRPIGRRSTRRRRRTTLTYAGTRLDDPDTDGDGIRDGADDQDHDDIPNVMECSRQPAPAERHSRRSRCARRPSADGRLPHGWVNPFDPCLPYAYSRSCQRI